MDELSRGKSAFTWSDDEDCESGAIQQSSKYDKNKKQRKKSVSPKTLTDTTTKSSVVKIVQKQPGVVNKQDT